MYHIWCHKSTYNLCQQFSNSKKNHCLSSCCGFGGALYHTHDKTHAAVYAPDASDTCTIRAHGLVIVTIPDAQAIRRL